MLHNHSPTLHKINSNIRLGRPQQSTRNHYNTTLSLREILIRHHYDDNIQPWERLQQSGSIRTAYYLPLFNDNAVNCLHNYP